MTPEYHTTTPCLTSSTAVGAGQQSQLNQRSAPYVESLRKLAAEDWLRLHVPAHQAHAENAPGLAGLFGESTLRLDFPMLFSSIDQHTWELDSRGRKTPLAEAQDLAAAFWGASRCWFITNGASGCNHIATTVIQGLGSEVVAQRSVHSSVIDGIIHSNLTPHFVTPYVDLQMGANHGVSEQQIHDELVRHPHSAAVYIVSPSYFGAVADVTRIAAVAHRHGVPLIVDEAWGAHFGSHPALPINAVRLGADLVISSTHKGAGSLTQTATLHLGHGPHAKSLEPLVDRVVRSYQSTSSSAILLASLDEARRNLATNQGRIALAVDSARQLRARLRTDSHLDDLTPRVAASPGTVAVDPLKIPIDVRGTGMDGGTVHHLLIKRRRMVSELATPTSLLLMVGATSPLNVERCWEALSSLSDGHQSCVSSSPSSPPRQLTLPALCQRCLPISEAFFADCEIVGFDHAVGRVSSDALAAYPPGVPNVLPGEILTEEVIRFLRQTAASATGHVRGAVDSSMNAFRVVKASSSAPDGR